MKELVEKMRLESGTSEEENKIMIENNLKKIES